MVETATTPIGFLPGIIWVGSHVLYTYTRRDEKYINNVVDYLMAGVELGEFAVCLIEQPYLDEIATRLTDRCSSFKTDKPLFIMQDPEKSFLANCMLDVVALEEFWRDKVVPLCPDLRQVRLFSDAGTLLSSRTGRLKLLEFEARMNYSFPVKLALCAYDSNVSGKTMLAQTKSVHPFIANHRSIRMNPEYVYPAQFLSAFYSFASVTKVYAAHPSQSESLAVQLVEKAARTPLTMTEIFAFSRAVTWLFAHLIERNHSGGNDKEHLHVTFSSESDTFRVTIKDDSGQVAVPVPGGDAHVMGGNLLADGLVDDISLQTWKDTIAITLIKRYVPFTEWAEWSS